MKQPLIAVTLDVEEAGSFSRRPHYAVRCNYVDALRRRGAAVVCVPHDRGQIDRLTGMVDGVLASGGPFLAREPLDVVREFVDRDPEDVVERRVVFEVALLGAARAAGLPVLGVCGGEQMLNASAGGTMILSIAEAVPGALNHRDVEAIGRTAHDVRVRPGTLLHRLARECDSFAVNTAHRQAVGVVGPGLVACAHAPDGVVEAIEDPAQRFCLGVQWHPEFELTDVDGAILDAFVAAAAAR